MTGLNDLRLQDFLGHMLQAIDRITQYIEEHTEVDFLNASMLQDAVVRNIEILGEASNNILKRFPAFAAAYDSGVLRLGLASSKNVSCLAVSTSVSR
jgi:hypothetical protein